MTTLTAEGTRTQATAGRAVVLHYLKKTDIAAAAEDGKPRPALCGFAFTPLPSRTAGAASRREICVVCAVIHSGMKQ